MRQRVILGAVLTLMLGRASAVEAQLVERPSQIYQPESRVFNIPPAAQRRYDRIEATLTREAWPGFGTIGIAATATDTTLVLSLGDGLVFPLANGELVIKSGGQAEHLWLMSRVGDALSVQRGYRGTAPIAIEAGATVRLNDLVTIVWERTLNGVDWEAIDRFTCPGGEVPSPRGGFTGFCHSGIATSLNGVPVARPGDLRVTITNRVRYQSAYTLEALDAP